MNEIRDLHNPFKAWLDQRGIPFHRNRPDKKTTAIKGDPDFLLTWCSYCVYIECKVLGGKLSTDQEKRIAYLRKAGNKVIIAYSLQECIEAAQGILCHGEDKNSVQVKGERVCRDSGGKLDPDLKARFIKAADDARERVSKLPQAERDALIAEFFKKVATGTPQGTEYEIPVNRKKEANVSAGQAPKTEDAQAESVPREREFLGMMGNVDWVLYGTGQPGTVARPVRRATTMDLATLPRR